MDDQPEEKHPQEKRGYLAQCRQEEVFNEEQDGHAACIIARRAQGVKEKICNDTYQAQLTTTLNYGSIPP